MSTTTAGTLFAVSLAAAIALVYVPFGNYLYHALNPRRHLRFERLVYRLVGVNPSGEQSWGTYARSVLAFSVVSLLFLYLFLRIQDDLWLSLGLPGVKPDLAWNTAASFVTNTNWQAYAGESTLGHLVQMTGLAVQNFVSAAVGICVVLALVRGLARGQDRTAGQFLGRPGASLCAGPVADRGGRGAGVHRGGHGAEPLRWHRGDHARRRESGASPADRWPARRSSRNSAATAAASTT